jgi:hypothetical protein
MISRRTTKHIADLYISVFRRHYDNGHGNRGYGIDWADIYEYLFVNDYPAWFHMIAKVASSPTDVRGFSEFILQLHTGETLVLIKGELSQSERNELGQALLLKLARDILNHDERNPDTQRLQDALLRSLELDGYKHKDSQLIDSESGVLDTEELGDSLTRLYKELGLGKSDVAREHLRLSEEHYLAKRWGDCISNSRNFLEAVLREIASSHSLKYRQVALAKEKYEKAFEVRNYLQTQGLVDEKETKAISAIYGLLSSTGNHPFVAEGDQARMLRQMALVLSEFVMLRYQGKVAEK